MRRNKSRCVLLMLWHRGSSRATTTAASAHVTTTASTATATAAAAAAAVPTLRHHPASQAKITRQEREATEEETAAMALLDEKLTVRQKQLEELVEGITKYKGLSGNALTALKIDLLNEGGAKVNLSDEANATKFAYEMLDAKKVSPRVSSRGRGPSMTPP